MNARPRETVGAGFVAAVDQWWLYVPVATTGDIVLTPSSGSRYMMMNAVQVSNLTNNAFDVSALNAGAASTPDTGATATTAIAAEYAQAAFLLDTPGGAFTYGGGFTAGGQDVTQVVLGVTYTLTEGYLILAATATVDASLAGISPTGWAGLVDVYK